MMKSNLAQIRGLIYRIVTDDSNQYENIQMTDEEWKESHSEGGYLDLSIKVDDWIELVRIARQFDRDGNYELDEPTDA